MEGVANDIAPEYVVARHVLLDALSSLGAHPDNLILVGAQAVYLVAGFAVHWAEPPAVHESDEALEIYRTHALSPEAAIPLLAAEAAHGDPTVGPSFAALVTDLLQALKRLE